MTRQDWHDTRLFTGATIIALWIPGDWSLGEALVAGAITFVVYAAMTALLNAVLDR